METSSHEEVNLNSTDFGLLEQLFSSEYEGLVDYARVILYNRELAEDVVQDTFIIGTQKITDLRDSVSPVGWLYYVLQNVVKNKNRQCQKIRALVEKIPLLSGDEAFGVEPSFESQVIFADGSEYRDFLKEEDWSIIKDFYCDGYRYSDLSKKYNKSVSACKMRVLRAKNTLAEKINKIYGEVL